jgi:hypothetical protein
MLSGGGCWCGGDGEAIAYGDGAGLPACLPCLPMVAGVGRGGGVACLPVAAMVAGRVRGGAGVMVAAASGRVRFIRSPLRMVAITNPSQFLIVTPNL